MAITVTTDTTKKHPKSALALVKRIAAAAAAANAVLVNKWLKKRDYKKLTNSGYLTVSGN